MNPFDVLGEKCSAGADSNCKKLVARLETKEKAHDFNTFYELIRKDNAGRDSRTRTVLSFRMRLSTPTILA